MKNEKNYKTKEACNVLNTIFNLKKITPDGNLIIYKVENFFDNKKPQKPLKKDEIIHDLERWGVLKIEEKYTEDKNLIYYLKILPKFKEIYDDHRLFKKDSEALYTVRNIRLNEKLYLLEINNREKIISFNSKKAKDGLEKETKAFKILCHLWDFRIEFKNGKKITKEDDLITIENLKRASGCKSEDATRKQIKRLGENFKKNNLPIEIKIIKGKCLLSIVH